MRKIVNDNKSEKNIENKRIKILYYYYFIFYCLKKTVFRNFKILTEHDRSKVRLENLESKIQGPR